MICKFFSYHMQNIMEYIILLSVIPLIKRFILYNIYWSKKKCNVII